MSKKFVNASGAFLRHVSADTRQFTGVKPVETVTGDTATSTASRLTWTKTDADGLGLFHNIHDLFALGTSSDHKRPFVVAQAHIMVSSAVDWTLSLTSGFGDGDEGGTTIDDPAYDIEIASGTGPAVENLSVVVGSGKSVRFTTASANSGNKPWFVELYVHANTDRRGTYNM